MTQLNHLARLAKWLSVRLQTKCLLVRITLLSHTDATKQEKMRIKRERVRKVINSKSVRIQYETEHYHHHYYRQCYC